ncbi:pyrroloquinoline quinone biosynthesis protein PqqD [Thermoplasmatales archaeon SG8-52-1]|nr:MAG: pyrroloquinoline quinone biosynthesis protein PqqD [Thermoplasmatales archaeon SG8-52-1]
MLRKNKPKKRRLPTIDEFLRYIPNRLELEWSTNEEGLVEIIMPKFNSKIGKSFCKVIKKDNSFTANMDKYGSLVWKNCDGKKTVKDILTLMEKEFPKEENLDQRLILFLQQMHSLRYINL